MKKKTSKPKIEYHEWLRLYDERATKHESICVKCGIERRATCQMQGDWISSYNSGYTTKRRAERCDGGRYVHDWVDVSKPWVMCAKCGIRKITAKFTGPVVRLFFKKPPYSDDIWDTVYSFCHKESKEK